MSEPEKKMYYTAGEKGENRPTGGLESTLEWIKDYLENMDAGDEIILKVNACEMTKQEYDALGEFKGP